MDLCTEDSGVEGYEVVIIMLPDIEQEREMCLSYILNWILKGKG